MEEYMFDKSQKSYISLREIITERTNRIVPWLGRIGVRHYSLCSLEKEEINGRDLGQSM